MLFADDQVAIADTEYSLQKAAHKLNRLITEYGLTISVQKTKSMAFKGRDPVRTKIVIDNKIIEQVNMFNVLKPNDYVMHQQFNIQQLYALPTLYLFVLYLPENKQRLVPLIA